MEQNISYSELFLNMHVTIEKKRKEERIKIKIGVFSQKAHVPFNVFKQINFHPDNGLNQIQKSTCNAGNFYF